ncbi:MAG: adenylate/guanylate cyclase domain-containing protein [Proteobacteria bacterium]|nr:adenylate/guanylate cyclase domain-containing protein [Pseudomonadota bacterium]
MQSQRDRRNWRLFFRLSIGSALISALFGYSQGPDTPLHSLLLGILGSTFIATPIMLLEIKGQRHVLRRLRRLPLPVYLGLKIAFYLVVILGGLMLLLVLHLTDREQFEETFGASLVFAVAMSVGTNVVLEIGMLLGFGTLKNLFTGRYVQPRREQRAFLLIDMCDSTGLAERLGAVPFHELLNDFFRDVSDAALECGAEIHKYVGDEAILTWPQRAVTDGDCLRCPFIAGELIEERREHYVARYTAVPAFRAALHFGEIVAGEIGDVRREIAYVGDTLNSTARLLDAAKQIGREVLASDDLLAQAALPPEIRAEKLPTLSVRGRSRPLGVSALARA